MTLLKIERVSKIYRTGEMAVKALDNVNLEIKKGEFLAIMGPSGSGKSTLLYIAGCLDTPTSGKVFFEGEEVSHLSETKLAKIRNQKIGFVFQTFNLLPRTKVFDNVALPLIYRGLSPQARRTKALRVLESVDIASRAFHFPNQLSGGEQQRVAIARALVTEPTIILADEPTGNLDSQSGQEVMKIFEKLNRAGETIVLVTHEKEMAKYARRIVKIRDGRIV